MPQRVSVKPGVADKIRRQPVGHLRISSDPSLCANLRPIPLSGAGPVLPGHPEKVSAGVLQVPLVFVQDLHTDFYGAEAERVKLLDLRRQKQNLNVQFHVFIWILRVGSLNVCISIQWVILTVAQGAIKSALANKYTNVMLNANLY